MQPTALIALPANVGQSGSTPAGIDLAAITDAYEVFSSAGMKVETISVQSCELLGAEALRLIFYPGVERTRQAIPRCAHLAELAGRVYDQGGVLAAVGSGPAGFLNVRTADGRQLVRGKRIAVSANLEAIGSDHDIPDPSGLLSALEAQGAILSGTSSEANPVIDDERIVTGPNSSSALLTAVVALEVLNRSAAEVLPLVAAPPGEAGAMVLLEMRAREREALREHLQACVKLSRRASGCLWSRLLPQREDPSVFVWMQQWASCTQQEAFLAWQRERGDLDILQGFLEDEVEISVFGDLVLPRHA
ncbi:MAG: antibiotic biosynthesis monooxygenase [Myxococcota bacterium]